MALDPDLEAARKRRSRHEFHQSNSRKLTLGILALIVAGAVLFLKHLGVFTQENAVEAVDKANNRSAEEAKKLGLDFEEPAQEAKKPDTSYIKKNGKFYIGTEFPNEAAYSPRPLQLFASK